MTINGKLHTSPAHNVSDDDEITVDGKPLPQAETPRLWRYYKPRGLIVSHRDEQGRASIFEAMPAEMPRVVSVGRLDLDSEGLILLTTSGDLARHLELPATGGAANTVSAFMAGLIRTNWPDWRMVLPSKGCAIRASRQHWTAGHQ